MIRRVFSPIAISLATLTMQVAPSAAEGALAIGLPPEGPSGGFVYGMAVNNPNARTKALNLCRGIDTENNAIPDRPSRAQSFCKIVAVFQDKCAAAAHNGTKHTAATGVGWSVASTSHSAQQRALADCETMSGGHSRLDCEVEGWFCDGNAQ